MLARSPQDLIRTKTGYIFVHIQNINKTNILTKKNAPPPGGHVFQPTGKKIELVKDIIGTILTINVASRVLTRLYYSQLRKNAPPPGAHFHDDRTINVASRVNKGQSCYKTGPPAAFFQSNNQFFPSENLAKNSPPPGGHFHEDQTINVASRVLTRKNSPPPGCHAFQATGTIFKLVHAIIGTILLTKFLDDRTINFSYIRKNATPFGGHVCQPTGTIFILTYDIIGTNFLMKFHEDQTINVASRVLTI
ncbi:hypothetical protein DPMN_127989 [Dreissena polymorpha]|uniref:Uncharacterized protein n=1 Tax=Dreissena polymorpha TaxID=45954 RepID=A0A9D4GYL1_DREPO|nr:hypothetical protein DPMN_127989 [Dreissena polymorpha]